VKRALAAVALAAVAGWLLFEHWRTRNIGPVQRGWQVASQRGCFTCHGPGGTRGVPNPGHGLGDVPSFTGGLVRMYVQDESEFREWILDGLPRRVREDPAQMAHRRGATIRMPAWRGLLGARELDDLVDFLKAVSDFEKPDEPRAEEGRLVADRTGCFHCHGPQGRGSMLGIRAFKGYIPAWDGADFGELSRSDAEIRSWILDGGTRRAYGNPVARWLMERQPIKMPAYRGRLTEDEVARIVAYIRWLRAHPS
jgi:mono/diheme cytochrome c family protein